MQGAVSAFKDNPLKTLINKGTELQVPIWHSGTCKAFLIHVGSAGEAFKKKRYFKSYEESSETFAKNRDKMKQLKSQLAELDKKSGTSRKSRKKFNQTTVEASSASSTLCANIVAELKQAVEATEETTARLDMAAEYMFQLHANLLSINARYVWNKIVQDQTNADPYTDLQGLTKKGPRGLLRKSFDDCAMFHLLTVFPNSTAEQERYYIANVLREPQFISICQFVQREEQLNSYILQLPCWYKSPSVKATMIHMNVPFAKADLKSHILRMCPYAWQDQFNLHKKGGTPADMHSLLLSLKAIGRVCNQERSNASPNKKALHSDKKGTKQPGTDTTARVPKKACAAKHCNLCKTHGDTYTTHNTRDCYWFEKDGTEKSDFCAANKGGKKPNPTKRSFPQLSKKLDQLEKVIKKKDTKKQKHCCSNSNSTPIRELGWVA